MSILTEKTERRVLAEIAQTLKHFENLTLMGISAGDAVRIRHAENIIRDVIAQNGYHTISRSRGIALRKDKGGRS
ncbi:MULTISPECIES: hypothetical protein [Pedobacter]|uniref:Uncharacterized protein n=1 Tax=Pedobacter suwonensis TaxID=332999 RepID=A0A1I0TTE9_9SPHI|nr:MULTISPECIES: hypothetical protein [Pedobacter]SFA55101.1 hypothetical protein SAMN04488511_11486 [Pedobacter suwonensis]